MSTQCPVFLLVRKTPIPSEVTSYAIKNYISQQLLQSVWVNEKLTTVKKCWHMPYRSFCFLFLAAWHLAVITTGAAASLREPMRAVTKDNKASGWKELVAVTLEQTLHDGLICLPAIFSKRKLTLVIQAAVIHISSSDAVRFLHEKSVFTWFFSKSERLGRQYFLSITYIISLLSICYL